MGADGAWPWVALLGLGIWHGVNPGMGWLLAVALGMQEQSGRAVWWSLLPLAAGHAVAIGAVVLVGLLLGAVIPTTPLRWGVAGILLAVGLARLRRVRHPRFGGMRMRGRDLAVWSAIMATAHGAGLMVLPFIVAAEPTAGHHVHAMTATLGSDFPTAGLTATALHSLGYLLATGGIAALVYYRLGLRLLRRAWINLDLVWGGALIATAIATPLL